MRRYSITILTNPSTGIKTKPVTTVIERQILRKRGLTFCNFSFRSSCSILLFSSASCHLFFSNCLINSFSSCFASFNDLQPLQDHPKIRENHLYNNQWYLTMDATYPSASFFCSALPTRRRIFASFNVLASLSAAFISSWWF